MIIKKHLDMLGYEAKDIVTGLTGIVESITFDLYGCIQALVRPKMDKKGELPDGRWFDIARIEIQSDYPVMNQPNYDSGKMAEGLKGPAEKQSRCDPRA